MAICRSSSVCVSVLFGTLPLNYAACLVNDSQCGVCARRTVFECPVDLKRVVRPLLLNMAARRADGPPAVSGLHLDLFHGLFPPVLGAISAALCLYGTRGSACIR